jgi:predicted permease
MERMLRPLETALQDIRFAVRALRRSPGFTALAVLTLGLGIGASTSMFALVDGLLLRPLPLPEPERLVSLWTTRPASGFFHASVSYQDSRDWSEARSLSSLATYRELPVTLSGRGEPVVLQAIQVTREFLPLLGAQPDRGRGFADDEMRPGAAPVVVLSHAAWQGRLGGDPGALGQPLTLDGKPATLIGVLPASFQLPGYEYLDAFLPLEPVAGGVPRGERGFGAIARLAPGSTLRSASSELSQIAADLAAAHPDTNQGSGVNVLSFAEDLFGDQLRLGALVLLGGVFLVLLIGCVNLASLLLARGVGRERELAVRLALGAGRARLVRQLLTESLLLGVLGAAAGGLLSIWGVQLLRGVLAADTPRLQEVALDGRALAFTAALAVASALAFGLLPALGAARRQAGDALRAGARAGRSGGALRAQRSLVVAEVGLAFVLLFGAGLLLRSLRNLQGVAPGFSTKGVVALSIALPEERDDGAALRFWDAALLRLAGLPGVRHVAAVSTPPMAGENSWTGVHLPGTLAGLEPRIGEVVVSPGYFDTLSIPLRGRDLSTSDTAQAPRVAVVNEAMARQFWPGQQAIGQHFRVGRVGTDTPPVEVVGVAGDLRHRGRAQPVRPEMFLPLAQQPGRQMTLLIDGSPDPASNLAAGRRAILDVDPGQAVAQSLLLDDLSRSDLRQRRVVTALAAAFALAAAALAGLGVHGLVSFAVAQGTREIGVRMALGAPAAAVLALVLRRFLRLFAVGLGLGLLCAAGLGRAMTSLLFGVPGTDVPSGLLAALLLLACVLLGSLVPARRGAGSPRWRPCVASEESAVIQDVRFALRQILRRPGFSAAVVLTLGLGIGASAAIFSVVNALLFRPLPLPAAERLVVLGTRHPEASGLQNLSYPEIVDVAAQCHPIEGLAGYAVDFLGLAGDGRAERVLGSYVTSNYFAVLGVQPATGRLLRPGEADAPGSEPVVVLGHGLWQRRFGADPSVLGRSLTVDGRAYTVIGVAEEGFHGAYAGVDSALFLPLGADRENTSQRRDARVLHAIGRLSAGETLDAANSALAVIARRLQAEHPESSRDITLHAVPETRARPEANNADDGPLIAVVFGALVALVLLVACVNVANLLLVRTTARSRELALRVAVGASRLRLLRQMLVESLLLSTLGGLAGAAIGRGLSGLLSRIEMPSVPIHFDFGFDWRVFAVVAGCVVAAALASGLVPALRAARTDPIAGLRDGRAPAGAGRQGLRDLLVIGQVAGCTVLLVVAGLFARSLHAARGMDLGFRPDGIVDAAVDVAQIGLDETRGRAFQEALAQRVRALPGVEAVATAYSVPLGYYSKSTRVERADAAALRQGDAPEVRTNSVSPSYFPVLGIPILKGRGFSERDTAGTPPVAVVNERLAARLWPGRSPIGQHLAFRLPDRPPAEVVGVARDAKYGSLLEGPEPHLYLAEAQSYESLRVLHVRTRLPAAALLAAIGAEVQRLEPSLPVFDAGTLEQALEGPNGFFLLRTGTLLVAALGGFGLLLAAVGVSGVVSYVVALRTHEIGIRRALGARPRDVMGLVLGHGLRLVALGLVVGSLLALLLGQGLAGLLYGVAPHDPAVLAGVALVLAGVALCACLPPTWRALRIEPMRALRCD